MKLRTVCANLLARMQFLHLTFKRRVITLENSAAKTARDDKIRPGEIKAALGGQ